jgi:predicted DCC family thiol-disulfide oxidoreductase YuxK
MRNRKREDFLIYDGFCAFCTGLAGRLNKHLGIKIVPSHFVRLKAPGLERETIEYNVHYVKFINGEIKVYHGTEAAVRVLGIKYKFLVWMYYIPVIRQLMQAFYFLTKKSRKYLSNLF